MKLDELAKELSDLKKEFAALKVKMDEEMQELRNGCHELEEEIRELKEGRDVAGAQDIRAKITVGEIISALPEFSPDSRAGAKAREWTEAVERLKSYYSIEDGMLLVAIRAKWTGGAQQWLQFRNRSDMSWNKLKGDLVDDFEVKKSKFEIMNAVSKTLRRKGQSLVNFFLEVTTLAEGVIEKQDVVRIMMSNSGHPVLCHEWAGEAWAREKVSREKLWKKVVRLDERERIEGGEGCYNCGRGGHLVRECNLPVDRGKVLDTQGERRVTGDADDED